MSKLNFDPYLYVIDPFHSYAHQGPKRNSVGNNNLVDYGDEAESDASTMTSASGTCAEYYDCDPNHVTPARHSRSRSAVAMSAENIATRSSSVPGKYYIAGFFVDFEKYALTKTCKLYKQYFFLEGQAMRVRPHFMNNGADLGLPYNNLSNPSSYGSGKKPFS